MAKSLPSYDELSLAVPRRKLSSSVKPFNPLAQGKQNDSGFDGAKDLAVAVGIDNCISFDHGFYQNFGIKNSLSSHEEPSEEEEKKVRKIVSPSTWKSKNEYPVETKKTAQHFSFSQDPSEPLNKFSYECKRFKATNGNHSGKDHILVEPRKIMEGGKLSAHEIMKFAAKTFLESYRRTIGGHSSSSQPCDISFSALSEQELKKVKLVQVLLSAAEKVSRQEYKLADRYLDGCDRYSPNTGCPVERVVYYFSEALREKIDREIGRVSEKGLGKKQSINLEESLMTISREMAPDEGTPFPKINQNAGVQTILENVMESKKVHIIDLGLPLGPQWKLLIEALATRQDSQLEHLKVTAVGTTCKRAREEAAKNLLSFAEMKSLKFSYKIVEVPDFLDLKEELLEIEPDETVAVYSAFGFQRFIVLPDRLDHVMKIITAIRPRVMVVIETSVDGTSPNFVNRFIDSLLYVSAYFDCFGECFDHDSKSRMILESLFCGRAIRRVLAAAEGEERTISNVTMDVWKEILRRYGPKEADFSMSSLYQTNLLMKRCPKWRHCTLEMDGKSLVVCWKGVRIHFASAWKFD